MAEAQLGSAVLLAYRKPQPQQTGGSVLLNYNAGAEDPFFAPMAGSTTAPWTPPSPRGHEYLLPYRNPVSHGGTTLSAWVLGYATRSEHSGPWEPPRSEVTGSDFPWIDSLTGMDPEGVSPWTPPVSLNHDTAQLWDPTQGGLGSSELLIWGAGAPAVQLTALQWPDLGTGSLPVSGLLPWNQARAKSSESFSPWDRLAPSHNPPWIITYPSGPVTDINGNIIIPIRRSYIVLNDVTAVTVLGGVELPLQSVSVDIDYSTWAWGFSASLPAQYLSLLLRGNPNSPIEVLITINGEDFLMVIESISRSRELGKASLNLSGRGTTAYLSSPYSPVSNFSNPTLATAQQLMVNALTTNGVPIGWTIVWEAPVPDWLVPANVWSKRGSYMDALLDVASSVGAYLLPDPRFKVITVKSKYPLLPAEWENSAPYVQLPSSVVQTEGIEWSESPDYNGVYVSGTNSGIIGFVRKDGTTGDSLAPAEQHGLITHTDAARERGRAILGSAGLSSMVSLSLPVLNGTGIIMPGNIIKYVDSGTTRWGISRGVSLSSQGVSLRQTIEVETHA